MNFDNLSRKELLVIRAKCDADLLFFTRFWYRVLRGTKFITNWHHKEITNELRKIENYELEFLGINIPPRFSKTELAAVNKIARGIGMNPTSNWLYITASDELRAQTSVSIRDIVSHPYFKTMYGVELKKDQNGKNLWRTSSGGGLKTATIGGQITGFGAGQMIEHDKELENYIRKFEGCIVLDDINKIDDTESENANNEKVNRIIFNTIFSRKNSADTPIINIQQRAGENDATERLMEHYKDNPKAKFLVIPARQSDGTPTWPWKLNSDQLAQLERGHETAHIFDTQYQQEPRSKHGSMFPKDGLTFAHSSNFDLTKSEFIVSVIDPKDDGSDFLCNPYGFGFGNKIYIHDVVFSEDDSEVIMPEIVLKLNLYKPHYTRVEKNGGGGHFKKLLETKISPSIQLMTSNTTMNKHTKIITWAAFIKEFFVFRSDYEPGSPYARFIDQITKYKKNQADAVKQKRDAPDACAMLAIMVKAFYPHLFEYKEPENTTDP